MNVNERINEIVSMLNNNAAVAFVADVSHKGSTSTWQKVWTTEVKSDLAGFKPAKLAVAGRALGEVIERADKGVFRAEETLSARAFYKRGEELVRTHLLEDEKGTDGASNGTSKGASKGASIHVAADKILSAGVEALTQIPRVSETRAARLVALAENRKGQSVNLTRVKGIGEKLAARIKSALDVSTEDAEETEETEDDGLTAEERISRLEEMIIKLAEK